MIRNRIVSAFFGVLAAALFVAPATAAPIEVAFGKPAVESSDAGFPASNGNDGFFNNFTHTIAGDNDPHWTVDLQSTFNLHEVDIYNRGDGCCQSRLRNIFVQVLADDGVTVVFTSPLLNPDNVLGSTADGGTGPAELELLLPNITFGRFVSIHRIPDRLLGPGPHGAPDCCEDGNGPEVLSLGEVQVFSIPEPASLSLLGLGALAFLRRRA
jgi:hypothetical protein